ncbi:MAG: putative bifunctional diguanylate cyclase/phosphodiesterase, partial [Campylobacterota bacterium]
MEGIDKLGALLQNLDIKDPLPLDTTDLDPQAARCASFVNALINQNRRLQADLGILNEEFSQSQSNLLESQKMAKVGSFEYDVNKQAFNASIQIYRILGVKATKTLSWTSFMEYMELKDRHEFMKLTQKAVTNGSSFVLRVNLRTFNNKPLSAECRVKARKHKNGVLKLIGTLMDITAQIENEKTIEFLAFHDPLTGLANRRLLDNRLNEALLQAERYGDKVGVLFLDLDRFKYINDTLGHDVGDELIVEISQILKNIVRQSDTISRLGGDEFVILLPRLESDDDAKSVAKKILHQLKKPFLIHTHTLFTSMSIGIAIAPTHGSKKDELITYADAAMYRAKELGRNNYQVYEMTMTKDFSDQLSLEQDLRQALEKDDEITLFYQPKVSLKDGRIIGAEALVRWHHPMHGLLYPDSFIDLAENTGMIIPIGQKVLNLAAKEIHNWKNKDLSVAVNLSGRQFQHGSLVRDVKEIIQKHDIDPSKLELEITETISMNNVQNSIKILKELKTLGVTLSIDDFGTGYSSLSYLKKLPVDVLKIDREFIMDLHRDHGDVMISKAIIGMGKSLDYKIVAEGIEMAEHTDILNEMDCEYGQGYFYSKAV